MSATLHVTLAVGRRLAGRLEVLCREPTPDLRQEYGLGKDEPVFNREVTFPDGRRMAIQVCQPLNNDVESCWVQGVLYGVDGTELSCSEVGESFHGDYHCDYGNIAYVVEVVDLDVDDPLTAAEKAMYLADRGQYCPKCRSANIEAQPLDADGSTATSDVLCLDCSYQWRDIYELSGIEALFREPAHDV